MTETTKAVLQQRLSIGGSSDEVEPRLIIDLLDSVVHNDDMSAFPDATTFSNTVTVGADDTGYDVTFYGATTGKSFLWDESADKLIITGTSTFTGAMQVTGAVTVGVDGTGHDVTFFGDTASKKMVWSQASDLLTITGNLTVTGSSPANFANPGLLTKQAVTNVNDTTPTAAELTTAFGNPATIGRGFIGTVDDNDGDTNGYLVWASDASYYWLKGAKAT